jgi:hypothetical protein
MSSDGAAAAAPAQHAAIVAKVSIFISISLRAARSPAILQ